MSAPSCYGGPVLAMHRHVLPVHLPPTRMMSRRYLELTRTRRWGGGNNHERTKDLPATGYTPDVLFAQEFRPK